MPAERTDAPQRALLYGDSNTYGTDPSQGRGAGGRYSAGTRWPDVLARRLRGRWDICTDALPGRCIPTLDFEWADWVACVRRSAPVDLAAVMLGANDYLSGPRPDAAAVAGRMERFVERLLSGGEGSVGRARVLIIAPPYLDFGNDRFYGRYSTVSGALSEALRGCARRLGVDFLDAGAWRAPLAPDGIHLTPEGHRMFAENMYRYFLTALPGENA